LPARDFFHARQPVPHGAIRAARASAALASALQRPVLADVAITERPMNTNKQHPEHGKHAATHGDEHERGGMTVREAGEKGGHKGGQRERQLVEEGHQAERHGKGRHHE
jgi:hypothetical protein